MLDFLKKFFGKKPKVYNVSTCTCSNEAGRFLIPKSEVKVPMPPVQPTKNVCRMDLQAVKYKRMEELAYYLAEADGFRGDPLSYWLKAEKQVMEEVG